MVIKYVISPFPALTENMVVRIWEAESDGPGAHVYEEIIPLPHTLPHVVTFNGADKVTHIVRLYSAVSASLLHEYNVEAMTDLLNVFDPIRFIIGDGQPNTPAAGSDTLFLPQLAGMTNSEFIIQRNGYGDLHPGVHYNWDPISMNLVLIPPDVFGDAEQWTIKPQPNVVQEVVNDSVVGKLFSARFPIAGSVNYSATHLRKLLVMAGAAIYTFPALQVIPIGYIFTFANFGAYGAGNKARINFSNGALRWGNTTKDFIFLPPFTSAQFVYDGANWDCVFASDARWLEPASATSPGQTLGVGVFNITWPGFTNGDVPAGSPSWTVTHNLDIVGDYVVFLSIRTNNEAQRALNDRTIGHWWHDNLVNKPNKFKFGLRELAAEAQNISVCWLIIKV